LSLADSPTTWLAGKPENCCFAKKFSKFMWQILPRIARVVAGFAYFLFSKSLYGTVLGWSKVRWRVIIKGFRFKVLGCFILGKAHGICVECVV
jgi:hypothetical protein